jgi:hypothetical protein
LGTASWVYIWDSRCLTKTTHGSSTFRLRSDGLTRANSGRCPRIPFRHVTNFFDRRTNELTSTRRRQQLQTMFHPGLRSAWTKFSRPSQKTSWQSFFRPNSRRTLINSSRDNRWPQSPILPGGKGFNWDAFRWTNYRVASISHVHID